MKRTILIISILAVLLVACGPKIMPKQAITPSAQQTETTPVTSGVQEAEALNIDLGIEELSTLDQDLAELENFDLG